jgi:hypothetical protein|nr:MAG: hypothetical protein [Lake Baikal virophage 2]
MTSYDNEYNRAVRNRVMSLDVANMRNDKQQANSTNAMHGGDYDGSGKNKDRRRREAAVLDDYDFRQHGMKGQGFMDDLLSGLNTAAGVANQSLDLYDKVKKITGSKGMGMSGGVRRGAEMSDVARPQGRTGQMLAVAPIVKGSRKGSALLAGSGMRGGDRMTGDNYTPSWRQIEAEQAKSGFIGAGESGGRRQSRLASQIAQLQGRRGAGANTYGMPALLGMEGGDDDLEGGDFFSDFADGFKKGFTGTLDVAGKLLPFAHLVGLGESGAGESGGRRRRRRGGQEMQGEGPISDLGIPGLSQIAGLFGLGVSGGADPAFQIAVPPPASDAIVSAFLGGRHPSKVSKEEKKMLFMKALADAKLHHELGDMMKMQASGMSGGMYNKAAYPMLNGMGLSGGDFFSDLLGTVGKVAQIAGPIMNIASKFGAGDESMSGGGLTDMPALNAKPVRYSYGKMGNIAGMANGAGMPPKRKALKGGYLQPPPTQVGVSMSGMGHDDDYSSSSSEDDMEGGQQEMRAVGSGVSGGKMSWINHVKSYAKSHNCSYKDALKRAGASYRGRGVSGGDFMGDLGNIAHTVAPFLEFL